VDSCNSFGSLNRLLPLLRLSWALKYGVGEGYGLVLIFEFRFCAHNYVGLYSKQCTKIPIETQFALFWLA